MYPELMVLPMREELTRLGIEELRTADQVDAALQNHPGTVMVIVNSICGCAAGRLRPAVRLALDHGVRPDRVVTVFAGQDREATDQARSYFTGYPPSSPALAILREGRLLHMMQRSDIEHREASDLAVELRGAFDKHCARSEPASR
jgi:putative YphP/YqiW family bacilliredoxin